jgi:hypothetical protein
MELRNTPPPPPLSERDTPTLVEDLCIALRNGAVFDRDLPDGARVISFIDEVKAIAAILETRQQDVHVRLLRLTEETGGQILPLFTECLAYPAQIPYVRDLMGLRRRFRCVCREEEFPIGAHFWLCDRCLQRAEGVLQTGQPADRWHIYQSADPWLWCPHADAMTPMVTDDAADCIDFAGVCLRCLHEERTRRAGLLPAESAP